MCSCRLVCPTGSMECGCPAAERAAAASFVGGRVVRKNTCGLCVTWRGTLGSSGCRLGPLDDSGPAGSDAISKHREPAPGNLAVPDDIHIDSILLSYRQTGCCVYCLSVHDAVAVWVSGRQQPARVRAPTSLCAAWAHPSSGQHQASRGRACVHRPLHKRDPVVLQDYRRPGQPGGGERPGARTYIFVPLLQVVCCQQCLPATRVVGTQRAAGGKRPALQAQLQQPKLEPLLHTCRHSVAECAGQGSNPTCRSPAETLRSKTTHVASTHPQVATHPATVPPPKPANAYRASAPSTTTEQPQSTP